MSKIHNNSNLDMITLEYDKSLLFLTQGIKTRHFYILQKT